MPGCLAELHIMFLRCSKIDIAKKIIYLGPYASLLAPTRGGVWLLFPFRLEGFRGSLFLLADAIRLKSITHSPAGRLIGNHGWALTTMYSRFAMAMVQPRYRKLYSDPYFPTLQSGSIRSLTWRSITLHAIPPRLIPTRPNDPDFAIYTGASFMPELRRGGLGVRFPLVTVFHPQMGRV